MLLPEDRLAMLLDQLRALPGPDRRAILARLDPRERRLLRRHASASSVAPRSPYSSDLAELLAAPADTADTKVTARARKALLAAAGALAGEVHATAPPRRAALLDVAGRWLRGLRS